MKVIEIMKLGRNFIEMLHKACIKMEYVRFIELYDDYLSMMSLGNKKSYAVAFLSDKYKVSERQVYYIISRLSADCKNGAEG